MNIKKAVVIIGAGVTGLICSVILVRNNIKTDLYDRMDSPGRKFLLAGMSGLNLTNIEDISNFASKYWTNEKLFKNLLEKYSPQDFISFLAELGIETFTGSSGKVFPVSMKGEEPLRKILEYLENSALFEFHGNHLFSEIDIDNNPVFETTYGKKTVFSDVVVFGLGGGSRKNTGSDGRWTSIFNRKGIKTVPFEPTNCGFEVKWSDSFKEYLESSVPLKSISVSCGRLTSRSEILLTGYGLEGSGIYFLSREIRERLKSVARYKDGISGIKANKTAVISGAEVSESENNNSILFIDILPDLSIESIRKKLEKSKGKNTLSNYLRKTLSINQVKFRLVKELLDKGQFIRITENSDILKKLPVKISGIGQLEEAISSAGGVSLDELDNNMMLKKNPGFYVAGEMADWEAPTGGYLMQGCFSTASAAAEDIIKKKYRKK